MPESAICDERHFHLRPLTGGPCLDCGAPQISRPIADDIVVVDYFPDEDE